MTMGPMLRDLLVRPNGQPRLLLPALLVMSVTFALGWTAVVAFRTSLSESQKAEMLGRTGHFKSAEEIYVRQLRERPSVPLAIAWLDNHDRGADPRNAPRSMSSPRGVQANDSDATVMTVEEVDAILAALPQEVSLIARYWRAVLDDEVPSGLRAAVVLGADGSPSLPWHNHMLAREATLRHDFDEAAKRFEREGLLFPERANDIDRALSIWIATGAWDVVRDHMRDPRVSAAAAPGTKYRLAVYERDWKGAIRSLALRFRPPATKSSLAMSAVAAISWGFFCARLGRVTERPRRRAPLYLLAFLLGVLSVFPAAVIIAFEEATLQLVETGEPLRDMIFFVFGVGLREEVAKILLFLPILPLVRKTGDRLEVLVCGALVGLGFAVEENLGYLAGGDLSTGLGRFLTANFLHMAATAILAASLDDFLRDRERYVADLSRTAMIVIGIHGAYDFLLSHHEFGGSFLAMAVFFFLVRLFLHAVEHARRKVDRALSLTQAFVVAVAVVTASSAVYAIDSVGLAQGLLVMGEGLLGVAIIVYAFVSSLRSM